MSIKLASGHTLYELKDWNTRVPRPMTKQDPDKIREAFIHHTTDTRAEGVDTLTEQKRAMRAIRDFHMDVRGYAFVGYHFVVFQPFGGRKKARAFQARPLTKVPAAQLLHNTYTAAICVFGNFQRDDGVKDDTLDCIVGLLNRINRRHPSLAVVGGHRDVVATSCPGDTLYAKIGTIAKQANLRKF